MGSNFIQCSQIQSFEPSFFCVAAYFYFSPQAPPVLDVQVEEAYDALRRWSPDFLITAGFHVLPPHAVTIPTRAALNFHPSALKEKSLEGRVQRYFSLKIT